MFFFVMLSSIGVVSPEYFLDSENQFQTQCCSFPGNPFSLPLLHAAEADEKVPPPPLEDVEWPPPPSTPPLDVNVKDTPPPVVPMPLIIPTSTFALKNKPSAPEEHHVYNYNHA